MLSVGNIFICMCSDMKLKLLGVNISNGNSHDDVFGLVVMAQPVPEFTRFVRCALGGCCLVDQASHLQPQIHPAGSHSTAFAIAIY